MKDLRKIIVEVLKKNPTLFYVCSRVRARLLSRGNTKRINGRNRICIKNAIIRNTVFDIKGEDNLIEIEDGVVINKFLFFVTGSHHHFYIGRDCRINRGGSLWVEDDHCTLIIGDRTTIEEIHIGLTEPHSSIKIGRDCMIANDVEIRCGDSHSIIDLQTKKRINYAEDVIIHDHVWISAHAAILKGSEIGSHSVIGNGAIVTKQVPPQVVVAGAPMRIIKTGITWQKDRVYDANVHKGT